MIFIIGILIGLIGYLMINNINLAVMELVRRQERKQLCFFILLVLLFELLYCYGSLYSLHLLMMYKAIIRIANYVSIVFLLVLGFWSLFEKNRNETQVRTNIIRRGYWSVLVHPQQVPFWLFWGVLLMGKGYLQSDNYAIFLFGVANTIGTLLTLMIYARYGNKLVQVLKLQQGQLKNIVGIICIASALFLLYEIW